MKLVCLSDTHDHHQKLRIPEGDVLIHAGDCTQQGHPEELRRFERWMARQPHRHKLLVPGNHERGWDDPDRLAYLRSRFSHRGIHLLHDTHRTVDGVTVYGTAWQPHFRNWAFNVQRGDPLQNKYAAIPLDVDVLITHVPPQGILDGTPTDEHVGSLSLRERMFAVKPRLHVFGHVHGSHGHRVIEGTHFVNGAVCDEAGRPSSDPVVLRLSERPSRPQTPRPSARSGQGP